MDLGLVASNYFTSNSELYSRLKDNTDLQV